MKLMKQMKLVSYN